MWKNHYDLWVEDEKKDAHTRIKVIGMTMNHLHSGLTDLVNILKQESNASVIFLACMQIKHIIMHLAGDWKLTKCCVDVFFNFGRMYKFSILGLLSHPIF